MFDQLLETKQVARRKTGGTMLSMVLHAMVVAAAIQLTHQTVAALEKPTEVTVRHVPLAPEPPTPAERPPQTPVTPAPAPFGHQVLTAPVDIPLDIPPVDLSVEPTDVRDWDGRRVSGGRHDGDSTAIVPIVTDEPMSSFTVDKAAAALPGSPSPAYPDMLKASGVEGHALVQFVVDTLGRAEPGSFTVLQSTHDAFGRAVRVTLPRMRFLAAEAGGRKVRMLVQQQFAFALDR
jgi:periplasmic protein TonB